MFKKSFFLFLGFALSGIFSPVSQSDEMHKCGDNSKGISFVEIPSVNIQQQPPVPLTIKGKLMMPDRGNGHGKCLAGKPKIPAVVILHGSNGVDSRGDFYAGELNKAGIATLEIDMWEARGITVAENRPPLPIFTYPDAFAALGFLSNHEAIDPRRIGVLGFSWGGVISMAAAETLYADQFGQGLKFAAHAAHYPVCYGYNNPAIPALNPPAQRGTQWLNLTGAPVLIQIGTEDDYDNGASHCHSLVDDLVDPDDRRLVEVVTYEGAYHAWDRLQVPITVFDPFANEGSIFSTGIVPEVKVIPDVDNAYKSRRKAVKFFLDNL